jgi:tryptophanyl-tRNA synthetase
VTTGSSAVPSAVDGAANGTSPADDAQAATPAKKIPRVLSGIQPTGSGAHLGNYLGAIRHWVELQDEVDAYYFIPDMHAITLPHDPKQLRARTRETVVELLACGLDPKRCTLFVQSHLPEHAQLAWVLSCITGYGEASRMTQFKDKSAKGELGSSSVGLFTYPILQAADILLYQADHVPVGDDQRQHLELTRDLAQRFNSRFGRTFTVPAAYKSKAADRVSDLQDPTRKMSKSHPPAGTVYLMDPPNAITKKVRSAVTDTDRDIRAAPEKPGVTNLITILAAVTDQTAEQVEADYVGKGYGDLKADTAAALVEALAPIQKRYQELQTDPGYVDEVLAAGASKARQVASRTLATVYKRVGFLQPAPVGVPAGGSA